MSHRIGRLDRPTRQALLALGAVLRELRAERGLSQRALASRCGLSQSTISRLETGQAEGVRVAWIARLLAGLDAEVRIQPDERHMLDRCRGFRKLRIAFDREHDNARSRARELKRRQRVDEILRHHAIEQADRERKRSLEQADGEGERSGLAAIWLWDGTDDQEADSTISSPGPMPPARRPDGAKTTAAD